MAKKCKKTNCGAENPDDAKFCSKCGCPFDVELTESSKQWIIGGLLFILIYSVFVGISGEWEIAMLFGFGGIVILGIICWILIGIQKLRS
ncbi:MAG: zinc ribbon domain-containing protein [Culturomica sp.]|jgi:hypothetical protein|nr:zinc ribbon domain-containing protein [Culturomica sp.]